MPSEIGATRPLPPTTPTRLPTGSAGIALQLASSLGDLLAPGDSAKAEVLAVKDAKVSFQFLLRLTLADGRQTLATAESPQPLPQGSSLNIAALAPTRLLAVLLPAQPAEPALDSIDLKQLPVGTLLQGKVVSSEPMVDDSTRQTVHRVLVRLLNTSLAGRHLSLDSPRPLPVSSLLSARVQDSQALQFLPPASLLPHLDLSRQLSGQKNRQASLEGLFAALQRQSLPDELQPTVKKLLAALPDIRQLSDPAGVARALQQSGAFLESSMLSAAPDDLPQDLKANLLRLIAQLLPSRDEPAAPAPANLAGSSPIRLAQEQPVLARQAFAYQEQPASREKDSGFPLPGRLIQPIDAEGGVDSLLKLAAAAVARLQTHQLSSLAQNERLPDGTQLSTWQMEIPLREQRSVVPVQVRLQQEQRQASRERPGRMLWRVDLAFDLDRLGPLQVQATLAEGVISSQLWAERDATARLIDSELGNLRQRLNDAGLAVSQLSCHQGRPPRDARAVLEQRWVDECA